MILFENPKGRKVGAGEWGGGKMSPLGPFFCDDLEGYLTFDNGEPFYGEVIQIN